MDEELEYLTWLAIRNNEQLPKRTYYVSLLGSTEYLLPCSEYEDWMMFIAKEKYLNRNYRFITIMRSEENVPRTEYIPWTLTLPKQVVKDCFAFLMSEE